MSISSKSAYPSRHLEQAIHRLSVSAQSVKTDILPAKVIEDPKGDGLVKVSIQLESVSAIPTPTVSIAQPSYMRIPLRKGDVGLLLTCGWPLSSLRGKLTAKTPRFSSAEEGLGHGVFVPICPDFLSLLSAGQAVRPDQKQADPKTLWLLNDTIELDASETATVKVGDTVLKLTKDGATLTSKSVTVEGDVTIKGGLTVEKDVQTNAGISLNQHVHTSSAPGTPTSPPKG